ncbi:hypothetical protein [Lewinella sp. LCG006]|uniref:hypothetical protein n=1 Tax=Lewinella sp. LCG006 TaxID=3231911 RepID=UPI0034609AC5
MIDQMVKWAKANPRVLFLIDSAGALLSAFLLGVVLVKLEAVFGIPPSTLYVLAILPCLFAVYDVYCYQKKEDESRPYLKGIALMNMSYCLLSLGFALYHFESLTYFGWMYILGEIFIVMVLARVEWIVSTC